MSQPTTWRVLLIDDTILLDAADALERELAVLEGQGLGDLAEAECLSESVESLRAIAEMAHGGPPRGKHGWPTITISVQGVSTPERRVRS